MKKYVSGLMFSEDRTKVALIRKNKPDWQKCLLNGIGGKIEDSDYVVMPNDSMDAEFSEKEASLNSICREFLEETGVTTDCSDWDVFLTMKSSGLARGHGNWSEEDWSVDFYRCFSDKVFDVKTMEDEVVEVFEVDDIIIGIKYRDKKWSEVNTIENLKWIILLALDKNPKITETIY